MRCRCASVTPGSTMTSSTNRRGGRERRPPLRYRHRSRDRRRSRSADCQPQPGSVARGSHVTGTDHALSAPFLGLLPEKVTRPARSRPAARPRASATQILGHRSATGLRRRAATLRHRRGRRRAAQPRVARTSHRSAVNSVAAASKSADVLPGTGRRTTRWPTWTARRDPTNEQSVHATDGSDQVAAFFTACTGIAGTHPRLPSRYHHDAAVDHADRFSCARLEGVQTVAARLDDRVGADDDRRARR